jgi:hypothetical protein
MSTSMTTIAAPQASKVLDGLAEMTGALEGLYRDLHLHPELSMQEHRTAAVARHRSRPQRRRQAQARWDAAVHEP